MVGWLDTLDNVSGWRGWTVAPYVARWLRRRMLRSMMGFGATFFPSREALTKARDFEEFLGTAESIDAIYVVGRSFIRNHSNRFGRFRRVIFPDPTSKSFLFYEAGTGEPNLAEYVRRSTFACREIGIKVRWCPEIIQHSVLIADSDKRTGWVHVELVMPCSKANTRPSVTIKKSRFESLVESYQETFNRLWDLSVEPPHQEAAPALPAPSVGQIGQTKPPLGLESQVTIRDRLLADGWRLNFLPSTGRSKPISFNPDGTIGEGRNHKETTWKITDGLLEITKEDGTLQNFFAYEPTTDRFVCTNTPPRKLSKGRGYDDQIIYRKEVGDG
jgi:hypothetical protein